MELGEMPGIAARRMFEALKQVGLRTELRSTSALSFLPLDRTTGATILIEDNAEARRLAEEMIRAGVPVERIAE